MLVLGKPTKSATALTFIATIKNLSEGRKSWNCATLPPSRGELRRFLSPFHFGCGGSGSWKWFILIIWLHRVNSLRPVSNSLLSDYLFPEFSYLVSGIRVYVLTSAFCGQSPRRMLDESMTECKLNAHDQGLEFHQRPLQKILVG